MSRRAHYGRVSLALAAFCAALVFPHTPATVAQAETSAPAVTASAGPDDTQARNRRQPPQRQAAPSRSMPAPKREASPPPRRSPPRQAKPPSPSKGRTARPAPSPSRAPKRVTPSPGTPTRRAPVVRQATPPPPPTRPAPGPAVTAPPRRGLVTRTPAPPSTPTGDRLRVLRERLARHPLARPRPDEIDRSRDAAIRPSSSAPLREKTPGEAPDSGPDADRRRPPPSAEGSLHDGRGHDEKPGGDFHHDGAHDGHGGHDYHDHHHATTHFIFISFFGTTHGFLSCFKTWYPGFWDYCYGSVSGWWPSWWPSWCSFDYGYYGYYGYYPWGARPSYYVGSYPEPYPVTVHVPPPACPYTQGEAWGRLSAGDLETAAMAFECLSAALPDDGLPATGHALALALMGERAEAAPILRSALAVDPEALEFVPMDESLTRSLRELAGLYEHQARRSYGDLDALFMAGAVRYLLGDLAAARYALQAATTLGDTDDGALNLQALIELALER